MLASRCGVLYSQTFSFCGNQTCSAEAAEAPLSVECFEQSRSTCAILSTNQLSVISYDVTGSEFQAIDLG